MAHLICVSFSILAHSELKGEQMSSNIAKEVAVKMFHRQSKHVYIDGVSSRQLRTQKSARFLSLYFFRFKFEMLEHDK